MNNCSEGEFGLLGVPGCPALSERPPHVRRVWSACAPGGHHVSSPVSAEQALPSLGGGLSAKLAEIPSGTSPLIFWVSGAPSGASALNSASVEIRMHT